MSTNFNFAPSKRERMLMIDKSLDLSFFTVFYFSTKYLIMLGKVADQGPHTNCASHSLTFPQPIDLQPSFWASITTVVLLFSYIDFRVCLACYPPESFKIIFLTCIWLKFVDTSFNSSQKSPQIIPASEGHISHFFKDHCVKLQTRWRLKLGA